MSHRRKPVEKPVPEARRARLVAQAAGQTLQSHAVGALPLINGILERLKLEECLKQVLPAEDQRVLVPAATGLTVLLKNILLSREPLYGVADWGVQQGPSARLETGAVHPDGHRGRRRAGAVSGRKRQYDRRPDAPDDQAARPRARKIRPLIREPSPPAARGPPAGRPPEIRGSSNRDVRKVGPNGRGSMLSRLLARRRWDMHARLAAPPRTPKFATTPATLCGR